MTTVTFDTHAMIESFIKTGIPKEQAEAIVQGIQQSVDIDLSDVATKHDLLLLGNATKNDLLALENKLLYWMIGNSLAIIAVLTSIKIFGG